MSTPAENVADRGPLPRGATWGKLTRYAGGSVIAAGCSEVALLTFYGVLHLSPGWSSTLAWLAGAVPNYWLNRNWAWRLRGRSSVTREVLPYVAIVAVTLALAAVCTRLVDGWLRASQSDTDVRVAAVAATFLGVYVVMFGLRFLLLDRLFTPRRPQRTHHER